MKHEKFTYKNLEEIKAKANELGVHLPFASETKILAQKARVGQAVFHNRLGTAPMEGNDALPDGTPSELTYRRYIRAAEGRSAMLWFEAISIVPEGRSGLHQLMITKNNLSSFKKMTEAIKEAGLRKNGLSPYLIMQANHSGRYSNPDGKAAPLIVYRHPECERLRPADDSCIVSDDYLMRLEDKFGEAALLAKEAGFDAVDIKACHGYLLAELLSAYLRPGAYGGSFENRTRLLRNAIAAAKVHEDNHFMVTARIGIYDGFAYPYGFGVQKDNHLTPDYSEPIKLLQLLHQKYGIQMANLTMGNPYVCIHVTRPFDVGKYVPDEHPLYGVGRMIHGIGEVKKSIPGIFISASAPTYLRQYSDLYAAGAIEEGLCDNVLFGRMSLANPKFAEQIIDQGRLDKKAVCVTCGKCGDLVRAGKPTGCVLRDSELYLPFYKAYQAEKMAASTGKR